MSLTVTNRKEIPDAPYYVLSNDSFLSGWGSAEGATNTLVLPCADRAEANRVRDYARSREEQERVRVVTRKPAMRRGVVYSLLTKEDAPVWYAGRPSE